MSLRKQTAQVPRKKTDLETPAENKGVRGAPIGIKNTQTWPPLAGESPSRPQAAPRPSPQPSCRLREGFVQNSRVTVQGVWLRGQTRGSAQSSRGLGEGACVREGWHHLCSATGSHIQAVWTVRRRPGSGAVQRRRWALEASGGPYHSVQGSPLVSVLPRDSRLTQPGPPCTGALSPASWSTHHRHFRTLMFRSKET